MSFWLTPLGIVSFVTIVVAIIFIFIKIFGKRLGMEISWNKEKKK